MSQQLLPRDTTLRFHHARVPYRKIAISARRPWLVRGSEVKQGVATDDLHALQESIERFDLLDPLLVLIDDEESPITIGKDPQAAVNAWLAAEGNEVEIVGGYRRLVALRRYLSEHRIDDQDVEVQLVIRSELARENSGHWQLALTKAVASSNAFFKEYSAADKLKLTRNLVELIDQQKGKGKCRHMDVLNLMGEVSRVSGKQSALYRASLRRFKIARHDRLYRAVLGLDPNDTSNDTPSKERQLIDQQLAEEIATQLDSDDDAIDKILDKIQADVDAFKQQKRDTPPHRHRQFNKHKYMRCIKEARLGHALDGSVEGTTPFVYDIEVGNQKIRIPGIRLDLSKKDDETYERFVEVAYKIQQLSRILTHAIRQLDLVRGHPAVASGAMPKLKSVYDPNKYKEFIYRYKAEQFAHPSELADAQELIGDQSWAAALLASAGVDSVRDLDPQEFSEAVRNEAIRRNEEREESEHSTRRAFDQAVKDQQKRLEFLHTTPEALAKLFTQVSEISEALHEAGGFDIKPLDELEVSWSGIPEVMPKDEDDEVDSDPSAEKSTDVDAEDGMAGVASGGDSADDEHEESSQ